MAALDLAVAQQLTREVGVKFRSPERSALTAVFGAASYGFDRTEFPKQWEKRLTTEERDRIADYLMERGFLVAQNGGDNHCYLEIFWS